MKQTRIQLEQTNARLSSENEVLALALADLSHGVVKWFSHGQYAIGISRPTGAAGGICIVKEGGMTSAHYFEQHSAAMLQHIALCVTGHDNEFNRQLCCKRAAIESAQAYITEMQRNS